MGVACQLNVNMHVVTVVTPTLFFPPTIRGAVLLAIPCRRRPRNARLPHAETSWAGLLRGLLLGGEP